MSAHAFQTVMANLIRYPLEELPDIEKRLSPVELSIAERNILQKMAQDPHVRKFGRKMSSLRMRDTTSVMTLSKEFIPAEILNRIYYDLYEPTQTTTDFVMGGVKFLEFLMENGKCKELLSELPNFLNDLLAYDHAKAFIIRQVIPTFDPTLPPRSLLCHKAFLILDINYDIPNYDRKKKNDPTFIGIETKPLKLMFLRYGASPYYRMFQIDDSIAKFVQSQLTETGGRSIDLPQAYEGMVKVGLCRRVEH